MKQKITTEELCSILKIKPGTVRRGYCIHGSYFGLVPTKLPNRRLLWDKESVERLASGGK